MSASTRATLALLAVMTSSDCQERSSSGGGGVFLAEASRRPLLDFDVRTIGRRLGFDTAVPFDRAGPRALDGAGGGRPPGTGAEGPFEDEDEGSDGVDFDLGGADGAGSAHGLGAGKGGLDTTAGEGEGEGEGERGRPADGPPLQRQRSGFRRRIPNRIPGAMQGTSWLFTSPDPAYAGVRMAAFSEDGKHVKLSTGFGGDRREVDVPLARGSPGCVEGVVDLGSLRSSLARWMAPLFPWYLQERWIFCAPEGTRSAFERRRPIGSKRVFIDPNWKSSAPGGGPPMSLSSGTGSDLEIMVFHIGPGVKVPEGELFAWLTLSAPSWTGDAGLAREGDAPHRGVDNVGADGGIMGDRGSGAPTVQVTEQLRWTGF